MDSSKLTKEKRKALRKASVEIVKGRNDETILDAARELADLAVPKKKEEPGRTGLRVSKEYITEIAMSVRKTMRNKERMRLLVTALWSAGHDEARLLGALILAPSLVARDEETETANIAYVRELLLQTKNQLVLDALAEAVSDEVEAGRGSSWMDSMNAWAKESEIRLQTFGLSMYGHLFSRGLSPEKLFDAFQLAKRLLPTEDPEVAKAIVSMLVSCLKKHEPAVVRFLAKVEHEEGETAEFVWEEISGRLDAAQEAQPDAELVT
ncbi:MAG: hypothetical protein HKN20_16455 [Gemmatimonadetes bacterium]|nr:hypothetical protein [Gemmatimonadota bacterium]